jgi:hypothetical protein
MNWRRVSKSGGGMMEDYLMEEAMLEMMEAMMNCDGQSL